MGSLDFPIEVRASLFNVQMPDTKILTVPMELSLKFVAVMGLNGMYPEGELGPNIGDKVYGAWLIVPSMNSYSVALEASSTAVYWKRLTCQHDLSVKKRLDVNLDSVTWHLLLIIFELLQYASP
jgi:hypothetical protein